jgi:Domain of unknown function (DUF4258)
MKFVLTAHARAELERRQIPEPVLLKVLDTPEQRVPEREGRVAYQSRIDFGRGRMMLVRAIVDERAEPNRVITVYRTSKIEKYWRR